MFGREAREEAKQAAETKAKDDAGHERRIFWKERFDKAQDGHEKTQLLIEYRYDLLLERLSDFDRRNAKEIRDHVQQLRHAIYVVCLLIILHHWL